MPDRHEPVVLTSPGAWSSRSWAWCPCGWTSRLCQGQTTARRRADQHVRHHGQEAAS